MAIPMPSTMWFLQMKKGWWALPAVSAPVPKPETMKTIMDKSPKSWIVCAVTPVFFQIAVLHRLNFMWHDHFELFHPAPPGSTLLLLAQLGWDQAPLHPSVPCRCFLHQCCFSAQCVRAKAATLSEPCLQAMSWRSWEGDRQWQQRTRSTGLIPTIPPQWRVRQNDTLPGMHSPFLSPEAMPAAMMCLLWNNNLTTSKQC